MIHCLYNMKIYIYIMSVCVDIQSTTNDIMLLSSCAESALQIEVNQVTMSEANNSKTSSKRFWILVFEFFTLLLLLISMQDDIFSDQVSYII